ncbi:conserved hypothetical protein [Nostocoides japonicum T1-X7]|uniref:HTH cro/C1-type domain-containing protein n=1 Tax=Nostocoides japonicum T1-X7 TaxID=1194083 RepID=A0A077LZW6_9MICO|nr:helix-turn-helix transcriptional regulator [Tetrasphaera japonica]CCH79136.1 conserved hypothetical protein [Tetrasphaera japonica T1-X7]
MSTSTSSWEQLRQRTLADPAAAREYAAEMARIAAVDDIVNGLADAIDEAGVSRAAVARAIGADPSVLRRLLTSGHRNPTIATVGEIAASLGLRVALVPMTSRERADFEPIAVHNGDLATC